MPAATTTRVSLDYGSGIGACTITGDVFYAGGAVLVEARDPGILPGYHAAEALRSAVRDGRIVVPAKVRAAIDNGAKVL